mgnify:FL=1
MSSQLSPTLKMFPHLVFFSDGLRYNISDCNIWAIDGVAALEMAKAEVWRGTPAYAYHGANRDKAIKEFRDVYLEN